ncbi:putative uroporphyrinogen decarboxylase, chloroplastic-like [Capsicum annuum]|nr:putative uroporphyrinogen decarboxylase, chloroplastic-like [Capsicum annuum]
MKGVKRSYKKGKLSPRYVSPFKILSRFGKVAYDLELSSDLASSWAFESILHLYKQFKDYLIEVSYLRILRWLDTKSNKRIKEVDLFNPPDDTVVHPWIVPIENELGMASFIMLGPFDIITEPMVELIKKELDRETTIRRAVRQGYPNIKSLHNQPTVTDPSAFSRGVAGGVVAIGGRHVDASCDDKHGPLKKVYIYVELDAKEKRDLRWAKNTKQGAQDYPMHTFSDQDFKSMTDIRTRYVDECVEEILCLMRRRQLVYLEAYDATDRIMYLNFYKNFNHRNNDLTMHASTLGCQGFDLLVSEFQ